MYEILGSESSHFYIVSTSDIQRSHFVTVKIVDGSKLELQTGSGNSNLNQNQTCWPESGTIGDHFLELYSL